MNIFSNRRRLPLLFYSYLATEMLAPFFASFVILTGVFFLVKLIPFLNVVLELDIGFSDFIRLFSYLFPNMFLYLIPVAAMLGVTLGFSRLATDTEILAFKASGIGIYHALPPVVIISIVVSLVTAYFSVMLIPAGDSAMQQMMYQLAKEKIDKGIKERAFTEALGDLVVHVDSIDKQTGKWHKVWVSDMRGRTLPAITMSNSGSMQTNLDKMTVTLVLNNGSMHIPDAGSAQTVTFDRYVINIPLNPLSTNAGKSRGTMTMPELLAKAKDVGLNTAQGRSYYTEFHKRLVLPVGCLFLCLLGMPLGLQAGPGRKAIGVPLGLVLYIGYYVMFSIARNISTGGSLPVPLVMWIPNTIFLITALVFINRVAREIPLLPSFVQLFLEKISAFFSRCYYIIATLAGSSRHLDISDGVSPKPVLPTSARKKKLRGNVKSRVFHFPECDYYYCKNCSIEFKDVKVAQQAGFEPCGYCQTIMPDATEMEQ